MSKISNKRKITYYIGMGVMILGFFLFISFFSSVASIMNNPVLADAEPSFTNAVIGFVLIIAGACLINIGAKGTAGSGLVLDPKKAREDLKPYNEAKGEMINDIVTNIDVVDNLTKSREIKELIKVRCRNCNTLNDEDAKFCKSCGGKL